MTKLRALAVFGFVALAGCQCGSKPSQKVCHTDADCAAGNTCVAGKCVMINDASTDLTGCAEDTDCDVDGGFHCAKSVGLCLKISIPDYPYPDGGQARCEEGETRSCGTSKLGECRLGTQTCDGGSFSGECAGVQNPVAEACDGLDNDCDGVIDNGFEGTTSCGSGNCAVTVTSCLNGVPQTCTPLTPPDCVALGAGCGMIADGCGNTLDCGTCTMPQTCGGAGVANQCGCTPLTACPAGLDCGTIPDGCGGTVNCGSCTGVNTCAGGGVQNVCGCTPATACPAGLNCGSVSDGCGGTINCGSCSPPQTCAGSGVANQCGCTPLAACPAPDNCGTIPDNCGGTVNCGTCPPVGQPTLIYCGNPTANVCGTTPCTPKTCGQLGDNCGAPSDGCGGTLSCGSCMAPQTCGGGGTPFHCGCTPTTCAAQGKNCGTIADGCGGTLNCGSCTAPQSCGGSGTANVCGCTPNCTGKNCGSDGCGGSCGVCTPPATCSAGGTCGCTPTTCAALGDNCGTPSDGCGGTLSCGTCAAACGAIALNYTCGGGGTANHCGCPAAYNVDVDLDGYTVCQGDCDDNDATVHPCAAETCDGKDNNCNGRVDDGFDNDNDCFTTCGTSPGCISATCATTYGACVAKQISPSRVDCNDNDAYVHPGKTFDCGACATAAAPACGAPGNGVDDNCNGFKDETCCPSGSTADNDGDGVSVCQGDCCDSDNKVYPGAPELCDGKDNDCNAATVANCDVGQTCNWANPTCPSEPASADVCKDRLLCAQDFATGKFTCGSFCNFSQAGTGLGDGCDGGQSCSSTLIFGYNDHLCTQSNVPVSAGAAGASCTPPAGCMKGTACPSTQCKSDECFKYTNTVSACTDMCGNDKNYCSATTTCVIIQSVAQAGPTQIPYLTGNCELSSQLTGTLTTGQSCAGNPSGCKYGSLSCFNNVCGEPCCRNSDCPAGDFCTLLGPKVNQNINLTTPDGGVAPAETSFPICVPKTTSGTRVAGQGCATNADCVSQFCDKNLKVCIDKCCNDADCGNGTRCDWMFTYKSDGFVELMRVCVPQPAPQTLIMQ